MGADELLILDRWACSSWEKFKRLLQPLLFRCSDRRGASFWCSSKQVTCTWPLLRKCPRSNAFTWLFLNKSCYTTWGVRVLSGISEQLLGFAWPSALVSGMPMKRTLCFKPCARLLANQAYEDPESHRLWRQGGDVLGPREYGLPNMGVSERFLQPLCSSVVLGPPMPLIMHASGPRWGIKSWESFFHLNYQLRKFCSTKFSPFIPKDQRRGSSRCRGQVLDESGSL